MLTTGQIHPTWDIAEYQSLQFKYDTHKDAELLDQYESAGHVRSMMTLFNYFEPNPMPSSVADIVVQFPHIKNKSAAINMFKPGQYLPMHVDLFGKYRTLHNLTNDHRIVRVIVMLENSAAGQISQVCDTTVGVWSAGYWLQWDETDPHAFYNFSMSDRYAIQITGVLS